MCLFHSVKTTSGFVHTMKKTAPFPGYCGTCNEIAGQMRFDEEELKRIEEEVKKSQADKPEDSFPDLPF